MRYLTSVVLAALLMAPAVASAQDQPTPAQIRAAAEAFDRGREAYKAEQYQEARGAIRACGRERAERHGAGARHPFARSRGKQ